MSDVYSIDDLIINTFPSFKIAIMPKLSCLSDDEELFLKTIKEEVYSYLTGKSSTIFGKLNVTNVSISFMSTIENQG